MSFMHPFNTHTEPVLLYARPVLGARGTAVNKITSLLSSSLDYSVFGQREQKTNCNYQKVRGSMIKTKIG